MSVTNGYCSLAELRQYLQSRYFYTASTISFTASGKIIADSVKGLKRFQSADFIKISGATNAGNNGFFTVAIGDTAASFTVSESLTTEAAGASITITVYDDLTNDADLERAIEAASRDIEELVGCRFYTTASDETRYFNRTDATRVYIPSGILAVTTLYTDDEGDRTYSTTWAATDFDLGPFNAALETPVQPYLWIETAPAGRYSFTSYAKGVKVVGKFGYCTAANQPQQIKAACLIRAAQLYKRKDAIYGVDGAGPFGQTLMRIPPDRDVLALLTPFKRNMF